jgi:hypothetical protein
MANASDLGKRLADVWAERTRQDAEWHAVRHRLATLTDRPIDVPRELFDQFEALVPPVRVPAHAMRG